MEFNVDDEKSLACDADGDGNVGEDDNVMVVD